jgi:hypothetical protein
VINLIDIFINAGEDSTRRAQATAACLAVIEETEQTSGGFSQPSYSTGVSAEASQRAEATVGAISLLCALFVLGAAIYLYGWRDGLIVSFLLGPAISLPSLLGCIPVLGPFLFWYVETSVILPKSLVGSRASNRPGSRRRCSGSDWELPFCT